MRLLLCEVGIALALTSCTTPYAEVSLRKPHLTGPPGSGTLASVEQDLDKAIREHRSHPLEALGHCLDALESTTRELRRDPANAAAIRDYDFAIGRVYAEYGFVWEPRTEVEVHLGGVYRHLSEAAVVYVTLEF